MSCADAERDEARAALDYIRKADRTTPYAYGEARPDGTAPPAGSRWLTPAERALVALDLSGQGRT